MTPEGKVKAKIKAHLEKEGWLFVSLMQTSMNGIPDVVALKDGRAVFIEMKTEKNKPTDLQLHRIAQLQKAGFTAFVARSVEDVQAALK
jgi:Holliday junction resolvase